MKKKKTFILSLIVLITVLITGFSTCALMGTPVDATITVEKL